MNVNNLYTDLNVVKDINLPILSSLEKKIIAVAGSVVERVASEQKVLLSAPLITIDASYIPSFEKLSKKSKACPYLTKYLTLYLKDSEGSKKQKMTFVGEGGSKRAFELNNGKVLILPNMNQDSIPTVQVRWERMLNEEMAMMKILRSIGLLTPLAEKVEIDFINMEREERAMQAIMEETIEGRIPKGTDVNELLKQEMEKIQIDAKKKVNLPAYTLDSFDSLAKKGCFVIDVKNKESSTWVENQNFLFVTQEEKLKLENWDNVLGPLITDIAIILYYGILIDRDSSNFAIIKNEQMPSSNQKLSCKYTVRYFGFDFSSKTSPLEIPTMEELKIDLSSIENREEVKQSVGDTIEPFISELFYYEFDKKSVNLQEILSFKRTLIERCVDRCIHQIEKMQKINSGNMLNCHLDC
jgi:hypothetical protein